MSNKFLRFQRLREITPAGMDGHRYRLQFDVGEKQGKDFHSRESHSVDVDVSGTLQAVWRKSDAQMSAYAGTSVTPRILELARTNELGSLVEPLRLNTYTAPNQPPASPQLQPGMLLPLEDAASVPSRSVWSFLSEDISEMRDQINALSKGLWNDRLLFLSQERPLFDIYKSAQNVEEFRARIQSLGVIVKDLNRDLLRRLSGVSPETQLGEFVLLERVLGTIATAEVTAAVCTPLKQINNLRQGYPTHGDKFLASTSNR